MVPGYSDRDGQERLDLLDRAAGHDGQGPAEPPGQAFQQAGESRRDHHGIGPGSDLHQGSVEIKEKSRPVGRYRRFMHDGGNVAHRATDGSPIAVL